MSNIIKLPMLDLQVFAEGTGDGGTAPGSADNGSFANSTGGTDLSEMIYGKTEGIASPEDNEDRVAKFNDLIKGEYKDLYDSKVQDIVQKRLKGSKETVDKYNALAPTLDVLARKYGVDPSDVEALNRAIEEDDSYFEDEALEKGITVQQLKEIRKMERENADLRRQMQERANQEQAERDVAMWMEQAKDAKRSYPGLDLGEELKNPQFVALLRNGIDVGSAYFVMHKDELIPQAMQYTAKTVESKLANKIAAAGARPQENGINSSASSIVKSDVSQLSKEDRDEIARRVARGERITF